MTYTDLAHAKEVALRLSHWLEDNDIDENVSLAATCILLAALAKSDNATEQAERVRIIINIINGALEEMQHQAAQ